MSVKKADNKNGFLLAPITLSAPVKTTDGFTNLVDVPKSLEGAAAKAEQQIDSRATEKRKTDHGIFNEAPTMQPNIDESGENEVGNALKDSFHRDEEGERPAENKSLTEAELLRILDADSLNEIYELTDVLRASSLKLYAALVRLADERGRARVKNHELMSKAGIKGIATLYKQERWLMDLKLLEKKAKPGPHDGSSYVVHKLEVLPLPTEIYNKFDEYLSALK